MRIFLLIALVCGCSYVSTTTITAKGEKMSVPVGGFAVVKGDVVDVKIERTMTAAGLARGGCNESIVSTPQVP